MYVSCHDLINHHSGPKLYKPKGERAVHAIAVSELYGFQGTAHSLDVPHTHTNQAPEDKDL